MLFNVFKEFNACTNFLDIYDVGFILSFLTIPSIKQLQFKYFNNALIITYSCDICTLLVKRNNFVIKAFIQWYRKGGTSGGKSPEGACYHKFYTICLST